MNYAAAKKMLDKCGQGHVLAWWNKLSKKGQNALLEQVGKIDPTSLAYCQKALKAGTAAIDNSKGKAPKVAVLKGKKLAEAVAIGEKELKAGRVAALLVAGGQGSRLGYDGPKGCYSIGPITGAPLFYVHARKILARTIRYGRTIPFYVMTSEANNEATIRCFEENEYFGLNPKDVFFFTQGMWPGMTQDGKIIMDAPGHVFMSPDGHGGLIAALKRSGALEDMKKRGIKSVFFFQVDNPLVEIADPAFIGLHALEKSEYSLKLTAKRDPSEGLGMVVKRDGHFDMIEYTEMTDEMNNRRRADGELYFKYGSPAIHVFDRAFLEKEAAKAMPLHLAHKKIPYVDASGKTVKPTEPNGYKFEKFIFDALADAKGASCCAFDRRDEFSPVKNAEGKDSPATCQADLQAKWRRQLAAAGVTVADGVPVEIDPVYALDARDLASTGLLLQGC